MIAALLGLSEASRLVQKQDEDEDYYGPMQMPVDPYAAETRDQITDLRTRLAEETQETYVPKTEYDEQTETSNFIDTFASQVERKERVQEMGQLEHKISVLQKRNVSLDDDEREEQAEHIAQQQQRLAEVRR